MATLNLKITGLYAAIALTFAVVPVNPAEERLNAPHVTDSVPTVYQPSSLNSPLLQASANKTMSSIFAGIQDSEYEINWQDAAKAHQSPNRANNLRFTYLPTGFTVERRVPETETDLWLAGIFLNGIGEPKLFQPNWAANLKISKKKAEIKHGIIGIEYENQFEGMRQNFILAQKPNAKPGITLWLGVQMEGVGMLVEENGSSISFANIVTGEIEFHYKDLHVWDAQNTALPARFIPVSESEFAIVIDDTRAVYPVTVDPISDSPWRQLYQNDSGCKFGFSVAHHHVSDYLKVGLIVGAPYFDNGQTDEGKVFVYYENENSNLSTNADWTAESNQAYAHFGWSVAGLDIDFDADGYYTDVAIGTPGYDYNGYDKGAVFIYNGSIDGMGQSGTPDNADWVKYGEQNNSQFGYSITGVYNIKNDSYDSLAVGAPYYSDLSGPIYYVGKVYVFYGAGTGISTNAGRIYTGTSYAMGLGWSVADGEDVNGDGYGDFIAAAPDLSSGPGQVFIFQGSPTGLPSCANRTLTGSQNSCRFGYCVASAGDLNGDSYTDIIIGAPCYDYNGNTDCGGALVYHGSSSGIGSSSDWFMVSDQAGAKFGWSVANAGDYDNNGYTGVIVGMPYLHYAGYADSGRIAVWEGSANGLSTSTAFENTNLNANILMGYSVCRIQMRYYRGIVAGLPGNNNVAVFIDE